MTKIIDTASCILVTIESTVSQACQECTSGVDDEIQLFTLLYYVTNRICIKWKFVTKSLYVISGFAFYTVMIQIVLMVADFVTAVETAFDL